MVSLPSGIADQEQLGRAVFDSKAAKDAVKGKFAPRRFIERDGIPELSVDRLSFGGLDQIATFQDQVRDAHCHGWAVISAEVARRSNRTTTADPVEGNSYHAIITLPGTPSLEEFIAQQKEHGLEMAMNAVWQPRPPIQP